MILMLIMNPFRGLLYFGWRRGQVWWRSLCKKNLLKKSSRFAKNQWRSTQSWYSKGFHIAVTRKRKFWNLWTDKNGILLPKLFWPTEFDKIWSLGIDINSNSSINDWKFSFWYSKTDRIEKLVKWRSDHAEMINHAEMSFPHDDFFNFVRKFEIETSKLSLIWASRLPILLKFNIQSMHSGLELLFFIKKHLFLTIYNNFRRIYFRVHLSIYPNSVFNGLFNQFWFLKRII